MTTTPGNSIPEGSMETDPKGVLPLEAEEVQEAKYVHPDAKSMFNSVSCVRHVPIFGPSVQAFGPKCVLALGLVYIMNKGLAHKLLDISVYPMFMKEFKVTAIVYQRMSGILSMGWSIKPLAATLCDAFAIFGYTKRWYMVMSCIAGAVCALCYGLLPASPESANAAAALLFVANFCMANVDVLSEGHYSRLVRVNPKPGADLISWVWGMISVGHVIAASIQGPVSDVGKPRIGPYISTAFQFLCTLFFVMNWYGEKRNHEERTEDYLFLLGEKGVCVNNDPQLLAVLDEAAPMPQDDYLHDDLAEEQLGAAKSNDDESSANEILKQMTCCCGVVEVNTEVLTRNRRVVAYGVLMTAGVLTMAVLTIIGKTYWLLYGGVSVSVVLCGFGFYALPLTVAKANVFSYVQLASYVAIPGALDTFYMADSECLPDGPHFTQTFYKTIANIIGNVFGLIGVYLFSVLFSKRSYRLTFFVTTIILVVGGVFDLIIVQRWNRPHINDHVMYIFGDAIIAQVCVMLNYMPMNFLIARLCPKGSESTMFAILAGFSNLGAAMGNTIGTILMDTVWPVRAEPPCDFSNVKWLLIVGHLLAPLVCLPLVFFLIPAGRVCDALDAEDTELAVVKTLDGYTSSGESSGNNEPVNDNANVHGN